MAQEYIITREGYINYKRKKGLTKNWALYWFTLAGGSLFLYRDSQDNKPDSEVTLVSGTTVHPVDEKGKEWCFEIKTGDKDHMLLSAPDEKEMKGWISDLKDSIGKPAQTPPDKEGLVRTKDGLMSRAKKNVASKAATSSVGKKAMAKALPEELTILLVSLRSLIAKKYNPKKGIEVESQVRKMLIKAWIQIEQKNLAMEDFMKSYKPLREAFEILVKINDHPGKIPPEKLNPAFEKVSKLLLEVEKELTILLRAYFKPENIVKLHHTFSFLADHEFLHNIWGDEALKDDEDLFELCLAMSKFSSFHIYTSK
eukprot:TRINITY_DN1258_c0_g1_i1.p1 TRINITY_DN1258_c0_g1~~TRINITY_DN1258_c0_g1_i1.p1  ORF type:complete len:312 (-),score=72.91 TRINITY_DN1258_c0_g1_i1:162-1097(-)